MVPIGDKCAAHLRVFIDEFHAGDDAADPSRPLFYSMLDGRSRALYRHGVPRPQACRRCGEGILPVDAPTLALPPSPQEPCHGALQVGSATADRDADARAQEHVHSTFIRLSVCPKPLAVSHSQLDETVLSCSSKVPPQQQELRCSSVRIAEGVVVVRPPSDP